MALSIKKSGSWKTASKIYIKKNGIWREASQVYIKKNGTWHAILDSTPQIPANPYTGLAPVYFDTWGIDLNNGNGNGWNSSSSSQAFYSRFYSDYSLKKRIRTSESVNSWEDTQKKESWYLEGISTAASDISAGTTNAAYFFTPPITGWSDKKCYIKNNNSWYELINAKSVDSGWYRLTFNGSSFSCSK